MQLTPQQQALVPLITDYLSANDGNCLIIEGVSGVGKSTLVREVAKKIIEKWLKCPNGHIVAMN